MGLGLHIPHASDPNLEGTPEHVSECVWFNKKSLVEKTRFAERKSQIRREQTSFPARFIPYFAYLWQKKIG